MLYRSLVLENVGGWIYVTHASVAKLDKALDYGSREWGFKSFRAYIEYRWWPWKTLLCGMGCGTPKIAKTIQTIFSCLMITWMKLERVGWVWSEMNQTHLGFGLGCIIMKWRLMPFSSTHMKPFVHWIGAFPGLNMTLSGKMFTEEPIPLFWMRVDQVPIIRHFGDSSDVDTLNFWTLWMLNKL